MSDVALGGRAFDPPTLQPVWLRPSALAAVVALHAVALLLLPRLAPEPPEPPPDIVIDVQPAPAPPEAPAEPAPQSEPEAAAPPAQEPPSPPHDVAPPKPPTPRVAPPKPQAKPVTKPAPVQARPAQTAPRPAAAAPSAASAPASAASQSAYISEIASAIRSRLFYPPAARARREGRRRRLFLDRTVGNVSSLATTRSSGDADLDGAARSLVQSAHFAPPPGGSAHVSTSFNYVPH